MLKAEPDAQYLTWSQLGQEVRVKADFKTVRIYMNKEEKVIDALTIQKPGISEISAGKRVERARAQLETHRNWEDWKNVLFLDEVHFKWSDEGRLHIKRVIRSKMDLIHVQHPREPRDKD